MQGQINPKIVGATLIGFALVAGAYTISNFGEPRYEQQAATVGGSPTERVAIVVSDSDNNGIEDWRDEFVTAKPVLLDQTDVEYIPPDTLTGQASIDFMENLIRARGYGPFGSTDDEVISDTVNRLGSETEISLYDVPDITVLDEWDDADIVNYANTMAATVVRHNTPDLEGELVILYDFLNSKSPDKQAELEALATVYQSYRDESLQVPVPAFLVKEHLDLINTYHAIHEDITAMTIVEEDPAVTLLRLKRYEDDATGLAYAMQNMYLAIEPYAGLFAMDDPAALFSVFSPNYQI